MQSEPYDALEALHCCRRWFERHSPTIPLINGKDAEHPMLTMLRSVIAREESYRENGNILIRDVTKAR